MARSKKTVVLLVAALLVLGGGGAAAWALLAKPAAAKKAEKKEAGPPTYVKMETFTVNLQDQDAERYLQTDVTLKLADKDLEETLKNDMPELRSGILLMLSSKHADDLRSPEAKQKLAGDIKSLCNKTLARQSHPGGVTDVFFNSFIIQ